jgi:hypothetical protein
MNPETLNEIAQEERIYQAWVRERKNQILALANTQKKQAEWNKLFPKVEMDDSYLAGNIF